jgi:phosphate starvation-inducible PhoH-like protein
MAKRRPNQDEFMSELNPQQRALTRVKVSLKCKTDNQKKFVRLVGNNQIVIVAGPAGTGKTYVACACALELLAKGIYKKIIVAKSVTVLEGEDIGYLKGSMKEKMEPIMVSFMDNFYKIIGKPLTQELEHLELIEVTPLAYIRGRSIDDSIIIVDEAQNITMKNMRSSMTRIGDNSKLIIMGDTKQIDLNKKDSSSLARIVKMFDGVDDIGVVEFGRSDIVRNPLIIKIEEIFDEEEDKSKSRPS